MTMYIHHKHLFFLGTGSHYIKELGRLLYGMASRRSIGLILIDGDYVEEKNLVRQIEHIRKCKFLIIPGNAGT